MKASETVVTPISEKAGGKFEIADTKKGGNSSWGIKEGYEDDSIRLAWYKENGGFDPISSAELPIWGLTDMVRIAAERDMLKGDDVAMLIGQLTASFYRQLKNTETK